MKKIICSLITMHVFCAVIAQNNNIFNGGNGDGFTALYINNGNIFNGGPGDGYATTTVLVNLPVHFVYFKATPQAQKVNLNWRTSLEQSADKFEIERSEDGRIFAKIGEVKAEGNATLGNAYSFTDHQPVKGYNYYRLKQIDNDANFSYTATVSINLAQQLTSAVSIYPQPARKNITIELPQTLAGERVTINFINIAGFIQKQIIANSNRQSHKLILSVVDLSAGIYILHLKSEKQDYMTKLIIQ